jgi:glycosyltransferase involved in cell wall biosynthesis
MLSALGASGHEAHLLCYAHGAMGERGPYTVHRPAQRPGRSLRSGPSLEKLRLDFGLARHLRTLERRLAPTAVVAHHVEAALCALAVCRRPVVFVAHTSLRHELPTYVPRALALPAGMSGALLDVQLIRRAARTLSVSPLLAALLSADSGREVAALPLPWLLPAAITRDERRAARHVLALPADAEIALYAGNFDAYQGLEPMLDGVAAFAATRPRARLLLATESPRHVLTAALGARGLTARAHFASISDEASRRRAHAAVDVALVPRRSAGGIPIKLLEALVRGVPVMGPERAFAGLPLAVQCTVIGDDRADAWCAGLRALLDDPDSALARAAAVRAASAAAFAPEAYVRTLTEQIGALIEERARSLSETMCL